MSALLLCLFLALQFHFFTISSYFCCCCKLPVVSLIELPAHLSCFLNSPRHLLPRLFPSSPRFILRSGTARRSRTRSTRLTSTRILTTPTSLPTPAAKTSLRDFKRKEREGKQTKKTEKIEDGDEAEQRQSRTGLAFTVELRFEIMTLENVGPLLAIKKPGGLSEMAAFAKQKKRQLPCLYVAAV